LNQTTRRAYDSWRLPPNMGSQNSVLAEKRFREVRICDVIKPLTTINPSKQPDVEIEYIDVSSVNRDTLSIQQTSILLGSEAPSRARRLVHTGDVIFATVRPTLKRITVIPETLDGAVCSTGYFVLRPTDEVLSRYLFYYLQGQRFSNEMESLQRGASYPAVSDKDVKEHNMLLPSLSEQQRIVSILDKVFEEISNSIYHTDLNLKSANEMLSRGIDQAFSNKDAWIEQQFGDVCNFVRGPFGGSLKKAYFVDEGYAVYEQSHAIYDQFETVRYFIGEEKFREMQRFELKSGDLIMSCSGTIGKIAIVPNGIRPGIINQALLKLTPNELIRPEFLKYWMRSMDFQAAIKLHSGGAAIQNIASVKILKQIKIYLPSLEVQKQIIDNLNLLLHTSQELGRLYGEKKEATIELKQSILQEAFNGTL
jgi:type I restriction enzyme, S subunit